MDSALPAERVFEAVNGALELSPVLPGDAGLYRCTAATPDGLAASHVFHLDVLGMAALRRKNWFRR